MDLSDQDLANMILRQLITSCTFFAQLPKNATSLKRFISTAQILSRNFLEFNFNIYVRLYKYKGLKYRILYIYLYL